MGCFKSAGAKSQTVSHIPEQADWLRSALGTYGPQLGKGEQVYPGTMTAEFTPAQKAAMTGVEDYLKAFDPNAPIAGYEETGGALKGILTGQTGAQPITPEQTQRFFKSAYEKPAVTQFSEYTRPLIREEYAGPGFWGSSRAKAVTEAGKELGQWLGQKRGELEWQAGQANRSIEEAKAGRALSAVPMGMEYGGLPAKVAASRLAGRQGVFGFAGAEQQQKQAEINEAIEKWQAGKRLTDKENMNLLMAFLGMDYGTSWTASRGAGMLGGGGSMQGAMGQAFQNIMSKKG